jgi:glycosyltransferase involved in cell wall biosynthesis
LSQIRPTVSVCLPVFNGAQYLEAAIQNIRHQTFSDFELIVKDDGSTDGSVAIIERIARDDKRIRFKKNLERLGLFQNYNACIRASAGKYIKLFAQDDLLEPEAIERMVAVLDADPDVALVTCGKRWIDEGGNELDRLSRFPTDTKLKSKDVILANLINLQNWIGEPSTAMFKSEYAGNGLDPNLYHWGDIDYWFKILQNGDLYFISDVLCSFRRHSKSTTSSNLSGLYFAADIVRMWKSWGHYLEEIGESEEHFFKRASERIALHLDHLVRDEGLKIEQLRKANPRGQTSFSVSEMTDFREALFHAERRITTLMEELIATKNELEHRHGECKELRAAVGQMQNSVSWKLTAPLRSIRSKK